MKAFWLPAALVLMTLAFAVYIENRFSRGMPELQESWKKAEGELATKYEQKVAEFQEELNKLQQDHLFEKSAMKFSSEEHAKRLLDMKLRHSKAVEDLQKALEDQRQVYADLVQSENKKSAERVETFKKALVVSLKELEARELKDAKMRQEQVDALKKTIEVKEAILASREKDVEERIRFLTHLVRPEVGEKELPILDVQSQYGDSIFFQYLYWRAPKESPSKELILAIRAVHEGSLGRKVFKDGYLVEGFNQKEDKIIKEGEGKGDIWWLGFERIQPVNFFKGGNLKPDLPIQAGIGGMQMFPSGIRIFWSRRPSEEQLKRVTEPLKKLASLYGIEPMAPEWRGHDTLVFRP